MNDDCIVTREIFLPSPLQLIYGDRIEREYLTEEYGSI